METEVNEVYGELISNIMLPPKSYNNPFIIAMCGHVGSGKSIVAKTLSNVLSIYILGGDKIRNIYYFDKNANHDINHINKVVNEVTKMEIKYLIDNKVSIVLDRSVSSKNALEDLKKLCDNIIMINLISDHKINIERITNKKEYNIDTSNCFGDVDSKSGVCTEEVYNDILKRKVYDLDNSVFDYEIDTTKSIDLVIEQTKQIAEEIKKQYL